MVNWANNLICLTGADRRAGRLCPLAERQVRSAYLKRPLPAALVGPQQEVCFIVRDAKGQALAYVYFEEEPGRRSAAKLLTCDEARRIAANIAKPPDMCGRYLWTQSPLEQAAGQAGMATRSPRTYIGL